MRVEIVAAVREDEAVLAKLLELYMHDFSEILELELGEDGRFGYKGLPLYWSEAGRHALLVKVEGKLAGFVLVKRGPSTTENAAVWDMVEFFVIRGMRRRGVGSRAAQEVWKKFPGKWEVRVMEGNGPAYEFWVRAIAGFAGKAVESVRVEKDGEGWRVFSFEA